MMLVTGGCGFIGSHIVDSLASKNDVLVIDKKKGFISPKAKYVIADILDQKKKISLTRGADAIFHFAADPSVKRSVESPLDNFELNVGGTITLLEAARANDVKKFVFASSSTIYGNAKMPTSETEPALPVSPYGASKASCDAYLSAYARAYGINAVSCVYGNIFGPRSDHGVMYDFYHKLLRNPDRLEILGDGKQRKSYLYISDTVDATILCADRTMGYGKYNISSDEWTTVNEIARIIAETMGLSPQFTHCGGKMGWAGDVPNFKLDISKVKKLGWKPRLSTRDGIKHYIEYLQRN